MFWNTFSLEYLTSLQNVTGVMFHFHSKQEVTLPTYTQRELHFPVSSLIGYSAGAPICQMVEIVWLQLCSLVGFPDSSVGKEFAWFNSWLRKIRWRRDRIPTPVFLSFPCGSAGKESTCNAGDLGPIPGLGRSPEEGKSYPHQYSGLENPHGQRSLVGYSPSRDKDLDMTEELSIQQNLI